MKGGIFMATQAKENAKTGILHWASKLLNTEGNFEKNLEQLKTNIDSEVSACEQFDFTDLKTEINSVTKSLEDVIQKHKDFTATKKSKNPDEIKRTRIIAQQAVQQTAEHTGELNAAIAAASNISDMQKILQKNTNHLNKLSQYLISLRSEFTRKDDKDAKAYGKNYAQPITNK